MSYELLKKQIELEARRCEKSGANGLSELWNNARLAIDELEFKLSHSLACLNAISENPKSNTDLKKFCIAHMNEIQFNWTEYLDSIGVDGGTPKQSH